MRVGVGTELGARVRGVGTELYKHSSLLQYQYNSDEDGSDVDGATPTPRKTKKPRPPKKKSTIYDVYEPSELERGHFLERDAEIRVTDQPERFQVRSIPVQPPESEVELEQEAEWVYDYAFVKQPISKQVCFCMHMYACIKHTCMYMLWCIHM